MNKTFKRILIGLGIVVVALGSFVAYQMSQNRKISPPGTAVYTGNGLDLAVAYSRPSVRGREIFGKLVPFGKVWRTGANEATTFTTKTDITVGGKALPAGKYSIFTIPEAGEWTIFFNKGEYSWGINFDQSSPREPDKDVAVVKVPVIARVAPIEQFTIVFEEPGPVLVLSWDKTSARVEIGK